MRAKKGISLIVLVITIIVIIILAAAVLLSLNNNNPINNSKQATFDSDVDSVKSAINMYIANFMAKNPTHDGPFDVTTTLQGAPTTAWIKIGESTGRAYLAKDNTSNTLYGNTITWNDLGFTSIPSSMTEFYFNVVTGEVVAKPTQSNVKMKYLNNAATETEVTNATTLTLTQSVAASTTTGDYVDYATGATYTK